MVVFQQARNDKKKTAKCSRAILNQSAAFIYFHAEEVLTEEYIPTRAINLPVALDSRHELGSCFSCTTTTVCVVVVTKELC